MSVFTTNFICFAVDFPTGDFVVFFSAKCSLFCTLTDAHTYTSAHLSLFKTHCYRIFKQRRCRRRRLLRLYFCWDNYILFTVISFFSISAWFLFGFTWTQKSHQEIFDQFILNLYCIRFCCSTICKCWVPLRFIVLYYFFSSNFVLF